MTIELSRCNFPEGKRFLWYQSGRLRYTLEGYMDHSKVEKVSKALADKTRLRIFEAVSASNRMNCSDIVSLQGVTPATVSHHMKILSEAGLIACHRAGQFVYSEAVPQTIA